MPSLRDGSRRTRRTWGEVMRRAGGEASAMAAVLATQVEALNYKAQGSAFGNRSAGSARHAAEEAGEDDNQQESIQQGNLEASAGRLASRRQPCLWELAGSQSAWRDAWETETMEEGKEALPAKGDGARA